MLAAAAPAEELTGVKVVEPPVLAAGFLDAAVSVALPAWLLLLLGLLTPLLPAVINWVKAPTVDNIALGVGGLLVEAVCGLLADDGLGALAAVG